MAPSWIPWQTTITRGQDHRGLVWWSPSPGPEKHLPMTSPEPQVANTCGYMLRSDDRNGEQTHFQFVSAIIFDFAVNLIHPVSELEHLEVLQHSFPGTTRHGARCTLHCCWVAVVHTIPVVSYSKVVRHCLTQRRGRLPT